MIGETPLSKFIALITFDRDDEKISVRINSLEKDIVNLQKKEQELAEVLGKAQQALRSAKKEIDSYELALKEFDQQIRDKKNKLESAASPREHRAIMTEVDALSARQLRAEESLLSAWSSFENRTRFHDECAQSHEQQLAELHTAIADKQQQIEVEKKLMSERVNQRQAYEQGVPAEWLVKYAAMRSRVPNPVVPVEQDSCSACFYSMSEQELVQLRRRALLQCKGCYRFLYSPAVHQLT